MSAVHQGVVHVLRSVAQRNSGALVRRRADGSTAGAILADSGRVCWARSASQRARMSDLLLSDPGQPLTREVLEQAVRACREHRRPLGEYLLTLGLVDAPTLRSALLRHTCEAMLDLAHEDTQWEWLEHRGPGYNAALTFSPADVLSGVHALRVPDLDLELNARLRSRILRGQRAFVVSSNQGERTLVTHVDCDDLALDTLFDLAARACELSQLSSVVAARGAVAVCGDFAYVVWQEDRLLHVIIDGDDMAFSRLVSQLVTINP
ncbi:MAG: hypothetical protein ABW061_16825 [Polyangiaceae bacterium]